MGFMTLSLKTVGEMVPTPVLSTKEMNALIRGLFYW